MAGPRKKIVLATDGPSKTSVKPDVDELNADKTYRGEERNQRQGPGGSGLFLTKPHKLQGVYDDIKPNKSQSFLEYFHLSICYYLFFIGHIYR